MELPFNSIWLPYQVEKLDRFSARHILVSSVTQWDPMTIILIWKGVEAR
jgi:hypothetical protein